jgi:hypothetical protein
MNFRTNGSDAMRIDASGNVGIGNSSPSSFSGDGADLVIGTTSGDNGLSIISGTSGTGNIYFGDVQEIGTGSRKGQIVYDHATDHMRFATAATERMRIGSNGSLELAYAGVTRQQADSQALSIITPATGGGQGIAFKRLDSNNDQGLGEISWSNNTQDGQANIRVKTAGAVNSTDMHFDVNNAGILVTAMSIDGSAGGNVGIGTDAPKANLHVNIPGSSDGFAVGGKNISLNTSYQTGAQLEITLGDHQACYVKVFITGDWSGHSAMAFLGEYFVQNGANAYAEAGMIIREADNTNGIDSISSQIYDGGNVDSFQIQFKLNVPSGAGVQTAAGKLTYQVMGQFDAIS